MPPTPLNDADGAATFSIEQDGVYMTVAPPKGKGKKAQFPNVERDIVKQNFQSYGDLDMNVIRKAVEEAHGHPVKIVTIKPQALDIPDAQYFVQVSKDEMSAVLTIIPPVEEGKPITDEDIRLALATSGVSFGIREEVLKGIIANPPELEPVEMEIAKGEPKVNGEDARLDVFADNEAKEKARPAESDDGRVDYFSTTQIENVKKGEPVARKIPASSGTPGRTVTGKEFPAVPGKDIQVSLGKGVIKSSDDENLFIADADGQVGYKDKKLQVLSIYEVKGDADISTGHIDFVGSVYIHGNIKDDIKVNAAGDIIVDGVVEAAFVTAGGKLTIKGGVMGRDRGVIKAKGDIISKYIRNCTAESDKNIVVNEAIMHSKVTAAEKVVVNGAKGVIVGGIVIAGAEIQAKVYGSNFATLTVLEVGTKPQDREEMIVLQAKIKTIEDNLDKTKKGIAYLKELGAKTPGGLPPDKKEMLAKLTRSQFGLIAELKPQQDLYIQMQRQEEETRVVKKGRISVMGMMYTGVKITIGPASRQVNEELKYCTITEDNGEIKIGPYKGG